MKDLIKEMVNFSIEAEPEFERIEKVLSFEQTGVDHSKYINKVKRSNGRNVWLWCQVTVKAEFHGLVGKAYLGACAYHNESDFKKGGYYEQMQDEAFQELKKQVDTIVKSLEG